MSPIVSGYRWDYLAEINAKSALSDDNGANHTGLGNTMTTEHEYEIDWTPDAITWSIDGEEVRQQKRSDTWNATSNRYDYPQTPSRVQLSLWPAGLPTNAEGTIEWAGGLVDWDSEYMSNDYYYAAISEIKMTCYDPPDGAKVKGSVSYTYDDVAVTNDTVVIGKDPTVLKSMEGTGTDMDAEDPSETSSESDSAEEGDKATVPGMTGAGPGTDGQRGGGDGESSSGNGAQDSSSPATTGFVQGDSSNGDTSAASRYVPDALFPYIFLAAFSMLVVLLLR